jgi:hypothetical protein
VTGDRAIDEGQRVVSETGGGSSGDVVVGSGDRSRARPGPVVRDNLLIMLLITIIGNDNGKMTDYWINNGQWPSRFYLSK